MKNRYVIIYPWKFVDSLYGVYGLDSFSERVDVQVIDISLIFNNKFSRSIVAPSMHHKVIRIESLGQLIQELKKIRKDSFDREVCVNYMAPIRSFISLYINIICFLNLRRSKVKVLKTINHGMPSFKKKQTAFLSDRIEKNLSLVKFIKKTYYFMWAKFPPPMSFLVTHKLVAGKSQEPTNATSKIKVIKGHCHNYNQYLISKMKVKKSNLRENTIVFIDAPGPFFSGDHVLTGDKPYKTIEVWYPLLCKFFDEVEARYGARVVIAAHYRSDISQLPDIFGGREVFSGITNELVSVSKLVLTELSSAVAFATIYKKPVLYIYSDESKRALTVMEFSDNMAELLGQLKININTIESLPSRIPSIDEMKYQSYQELWLTSDPEGITNAQHIESEIMG